MISGYAHHRGTKEGGGDFERLWRQRFCTLAFVYASNKQRFQVLVADVAFSPPLTYRPFISTSVFGSNMHDVHRKKHSLTCTKHSNSKRKSLHKSGYLYKSRAAVRCSMGDSGEASIDNTILEEVDEDDLITAKKALYEAKSRHEALENKMHQLLEELATSKHKQQELLSIIMHNKMTVTKTPLDEMDEDGVMVNDGRLALLIDDESQKSKLINDGPRREIPDWMARRIGSVRQKFPPRRSTIRKSTHQTLSLRNCLILLKYGQLRKQNRKTGTR